MLAALLLALPLQTAPDWDSFPVFVWRMRYWGKEPPAELIEPFGGVNVEKDEEAPWVFEHGWDFYVGHGPGRDELHIDADRASWAEPWQEWYGTRDPALCVREPCLNDHRIERGLRTTLERSLAARDGRTGYGVSLGDEVSLTPRGGTPWDGCRARPCELKWRFAGGAHDVPTTDAVRRALAEGSSEGLGVWLERRRFHRESVEDLVRRLAERVPGPAGLLGLAGDDPFGGLSAASTVGTMDFVECYANGHVRHQLFTLRGARSFALGGFDLVGSCLLPEAPGAEPLPGFVTWDPAALYTVFLTDESPAGVAWQASEHWLRGGDGLVVWSDGDLEDHPEHAARLAEAVATLRSFPPRSASPPRGPRGAAIVHDADSAAVGFLRDSLLDGATWPNRFPTYQQEHGTRERSVRAWLTYFEDLGLQPGVVTLDDLRHPGGHAEGEDGCLSDRFPVLILPHVLVLSDADVAALEAYVERGGLLVVEGYLGLYDRRGRRRIEVPKPEGALWLERPFATYMDRRLRLEHAQRLQQVDGAILDALASQGTPPLGSWMGETDVSWLLERRETDDPKRWLLTGIPNLATTAQRNAHLADEVLELTPPAGLRLRWIHPEVTDGEPVVLPAGDAFLVEVLEN